MRPTRDPAALRNDLTFSLQRGRARTKTLITALNEDQLHAQPIDFLSPLVWDVGHVACFEDLWLVRRLTGRPSRDPQRDNLYDAFEHPRWTRGELALMPATEAMQHLDQVRADTLAVLKNLHFEPDAPLIANGTVHRMIAQHELQHLETMLQSLACRTGGYEPPRAFPITSARRVDDCDRVFVTGGKFLLGTNDSSCTFDNERPQHLVELAPFEIDRFPVTTRRFAEFIGNDGYSRAELWSERGWHWQQASGHMAPQGWVQDRYGDWQRLRFGRAEPLDPRVPVEHISFFEAEAFANWAGGRLPTEIEWEMAASWDPAKQTKRRYPWGENTPTAEQANLDGRYFGPQPVGSYPKGASPFGVEQLVGDVYEWTSSSFEPYPGFSAFPYPEYSEVFFGGDYRVLKGSSWAIGSELARTTYRNWDHPYRRQIFAGMRLAYDVHH